VRKKNRRPDATEKGKLAEGDLPKHSHRDRSGKTAKAGGRHRAVDRPKGKGKEKMKKHPGFKAVEAKIGREKGIRNPGAVLAAATRGASKAAKKANPRLKRVR
jgi:hypothetical protein